MQPTKRGVRGEEEFDNLANSNWPQTGMLDLAAFMANVLASKKLAQIFIIFHFHFHFQRQFELNRAKV